MYHVAIFHKILYTSGSSMVMIALASLRRRVIVIRQGKNKDRHVIDGVLIRWE